MIAIAGAKGGCGKTVTTLGLAEAFGRAEIATLAVDADRQLPNLHVAAGVDRNPTLASVDEESPITEIAQPHPSEPYVGVLPAADATTDVEATLSRLDAEPMTVLVDCPSGAGPDVVEPMTASSGALVVTTPTGRSLESAAKTIEIARRLEVPILGIVVTRSESVPDGVASRLDVPVIGTVPECSAPGTDEVARRAYDGIASELLRTDVVGRRPRRAAIDRLPVGIDALDERLGGGVPGGSIVALAADPASQSERLLYETTAARRTLYLTTRPSSRNVERAVALSNPEAEATTVRRLGRRDALENARACVEALPRKATLVVDSVDVLERADRSAYVAFLETLADTLHETDSVAVLHCLKGRSVPANRPTTNHAADVVCDLRTVPSDREAESDRYLSILKSRFGSAGSIRITAGGANDTDGIGGSTPGRAAGSAPERVD